MGIVPAHTPTALVIPQHAPMTVWPTALILTVSAIPQQPVATGIVPAHIPTASVTLQHEFPGRQFCRITVLRFVISKNLSNFTASQESDHFRNFFGSVPQKLEIENVGNFLLTQAVSRNATHDLYAWAVILHSFRQLVSYDHLSKVCVIQSALPILIQLVWTDQPQKQ